MSFLGRSSRIRESFFRPGVGFLVCSVMAIAIIAVFKGTQFETTVPIIFLLIVTATAVVWGCAGAMSGLLCGAVIFALALFAPIGSLSISSQAARANLGWMLLLGIPSSFLLSTTSARKR